MKQMQERVIPAFESRYPGKQALFLFDHSTGHHALPADALLASKLNLSDGGAAPKLRNTTFVNQHGETVEQLMQRSDGVQKGLTTILIAAYDLRRLPLQRSVKFVLESGP